MLAVLGVSAAMAPGVRLGKPPSSPRSVLERGHRIGRAPGRVVPALQRGGAEAHVQARDGVAPGLGRQREQRTEQPARPGRGHQRADDREAQARLAVAFGDVVTLAQVGSQQRRHRSCGARGIEGYRASRAVTIAILCGCRVSLTLLDRRAQRLQPARHCNLTMALQSEAIATHPAASLSHRRSARAERLTVANPRTRRHNQLGPRCHSGVRLNASRHHARQRSRVRSGMARPASADAA